MIPRNAVLADVFHDLVRFQIELWNGVDARLKADHNLGLGQFEFLTVIAEVPNCRVFDIAERLVITVGGTSKMVDRLESVGLCERRANPDDRRSSILHLTEAGAKALAAATVTFDDELRLRFAGADTDALGSTLRALRQRPVSAASDTGTATSNTATATPAVL